LLVSVATTQAAENLPGVEEIIQHCDYKYSGKDQRTKMTVVNRNDHGQEKKQVFLRLLKNYPANNEYREKMVLLTEYPPDQKGLAFLRWEYTPTLDKLPEQWLYLPEHRKVRRVSARNPGEAFLGSTLTLGDIRYRAIDKDNHKLLGVQMWENKPVYVIESVPKEPDALYSKRISLYSRAPTWDTCLKVAVFYLDPKGFRLKAQRLSWQNIDGAWIWKHVVVENVQTKHVSTFEIHDIEVDVGLDDQLFSDRELRRGFKSLH
jgi:hypothetical protein